MFISLVLGGPTFCVDAHPEKCSFSSHFHKISCDTKAEHSNSNQQHIDNELITLIPQQEIVANICFTQHSIPNEFNISVIPYYEFSKVKCPLLQLKTIKLLC